MCVRQCGNFFEIGKKNVGKGGIIDNGCWMVEGNNIPGPSFLPKQLPVHAGHHGWVNTIPWQKVCRGHPAHGAKNVGLNEGELLREIRVASEYFLLVGIAIVGRSTFHDIGNKYVTAQETSLGEAIIKE
jgi:hypothetical protein